MSNMTSIFFHLKRLVTKFQELLNSDINLDSVVIASFDVTSLFTNIPVDETIEIISKYLLIVFFVVLNVYIIVQKRVGVKNTKPSLF